jgi:hypothetical protein
VLCAGAAADARTRLRPAALRADATKGCRLAPARLAAGNWNVSGPVDQVKYTAGSDEVRLTLVQDRGPRLANLDLTGPYGLYTARVKACREQGCITAFYVRLHPVQMLECG